MIAAGDRIEVVALMADDPLPPPIGAKGWVTSIEPAIVNHDDGFHYKAFVRWDEGVVAVSALLIPDDNYVYRVVAE